MAMLVYQDVFGGWRWELDLGNGNIVDSRYSYETRKQCMAAARDAGADRGNESTGRQPPVSNRKPSQLRPAATLERRAQRSRA
jgi:uncharacterized protein YegP (UPF0339 family)